MAVIILLYQYLASSGMFGPNEFTKTKFIENQACFVTSLSLSILRFFQCFAPE